MPPTPPLLARLAAALAGLALAGAATPVRAGVASDKLKRADTLAQPSVVLVVTTLQGVVLDDREPGRPPHDVTVPVTGTGFFASSDGFVVTAAHVVAPTKEEIADIVGSAYVSLRLRAQGCEQAGTCASRIDGELAAAAPHLLVAVQLSTVRVVTQDQRLGPDPAAVGAGAEIRTVSPPAQKDTAVLKIVGQNEPVLPVGDSDKVGVADSVSVIGYPGAANGLVSADTQLVPTVTSGSITSKKHGSPALGLAGDANLLQTDATIEHGNSGGPAVDENGAAVGIVSFGPESATSSFLVTSNDVRAVMSEAGVNNALGPIDALWAQGLDLFDRQDYAGARDRFDRCAALNSAQVGCRDYARRAAAMPQGSAAGSSGGAAGRPAAAGGVPVAVLGAGAAAAVLALVAVALVLMRRRARRGAAPGPAEGAAPAPAASGDPPRGGSAAPTNGGAGPPAAEPARWPPVLRAAAPAGSNGTPAPAAAAGRTATNSRGTWGLTGPIGAAAAPVDPGLAPEPRPAPPAAKSGPPRPWTCTSCGIGFYRGDPGCPRCGTEAVAG